jgi:phosphatidate phosphatase APP1
MSGHDVEIVPYRSYGTSRFLFLRGRVMAARGLAGAPDQTSWRNLTDSWRRFETDEIPGARVSALWRDSSAILTCDAEGYFAASVEIGATNVSGWQDVALQLVDPPLPDIAATAHVLVPAATATFGVISDLDDTVVESNVGNRFELLRTIALGNASTRIPVEGVAQFYAALRDGPSGADDNPIFYVSGGPWNLYDVYHDFLALQKIPAGPILLADFGLNTDLFIHPPHQVHKKEKIDHILATYPALPLVLIGDSGEEDPEIYLDIVRAHPGRVKLVMIRAVGALTQARMDRIGEDVRAANAELVILRTAADAVREAASHGLIPLSS